MSNNIYLPLIFKGVMAFWQAVPEVCLWDVHFAENIHYYLHCSMWIISLMIMLAIDVTEITGLKSVK